MARTVSEVTTAPPINPCYPLPPLLQAPTSVPARPQGAFGQRFPQNVPSLGSSEAVASRGLAPLGHHKAAEQLGPDGLPHVGAVIWPGESYYCTQDLNDKRFSPHKLKGEEVAQVGGAWLHLLAALAAVLPRAPAACRVSVHRHWHLQAQGRWLLVLRQGKCWGLGSRTACIGVCMSAACVRARAVMSMLSLLLT
jgi:hypothetical protein